MPKRNLIRNVISGDELHQRMANGVDKISLVASSAYGNNSGNVLIENRYGEPTVSHDGITNVASLVSNDPIENATISIIRQASAKTDAKSGDATTLTIMLACYAYRYWSNFMTSNNMPVRKVQSAITKTTNDIIDYIDKHTITDPSDVDLLNVANISAGDKSIGEAVFYAVEQSGGKDGSVTVVEQPEPRIDVDIIEGFSFKSGLVAVALAKDLQSIKTVYDNPCVVVIPSQITKNDDILPILDRLVRAGKNGIVLIADVSGKALETIVANKLSGKLDIAVVNPPADSSRDEFMNDVAYYCSTKPFTKRAEDFDVESDTGTVDNAYITMNETVLNGTHNDLQSYVASMTDDKRIKMLTGKTARISVGAATPVERQDLKLRIDDAVCAVKTAQTDGVCYGGGVTLRNAAKELQVGYLAYPYLCLTGDKEYDTRDDDWGIDTLNDTNGNIRAMGIMDSAKAIKEAVINSHSAVAQLISITVALPFMEDME